MNNVFPGSSAPRIAIPEPTSTDHAYNDRAWGAYFHALTSAGASGVPIPLDATPATIAKLVASCVGVLLPGSPADADPQKYGAVADPECAPADGAREAVDELLLQDAFNLHKPLFGVCYGLQALNVWRGGTLIQHLPQRTPVEHDAGPSVQSAHTITVDPHSWLGSLLEEAGRGTEDLHSIMNKDGLVVNSSHHQAVDLPGDELRVSARCAEDGTIEALEGTSAEHFVLGVQWHPERSFDVSPASRQLFRSFVEAALKYRPRVILDSLAV